MRIEIVQSNYIPSKGYVDLSAGVDVFVLYDDVQYTKRDWRNRNRIKTAHGTKWLTVPVQVTGKYLQPIREVEISDPGWADTHWRTLVHHYRKAASFASVAPAVEALYREIRALRIYEGASDVQRVIIARSLLG